jgi:pSer/pThr/pTyr-binding forkhead associated (FHA) protein
LEILVSILNKDDQSSRQVRCPLVDRVVIGRGPECGITIDGSAISREHLIAERDGNGSILISDISANGCWINGARVPKSRRVPVQDSDSIEVPGFELQIRRADPPIRLPEAPTAPVEHFPVTRPAARRLGPVPALLGSFTGGEKIAAFFALVSLALVLIYALS